MAHPARRVRASLLEKNRLSQFSAAEIGTLEIFRA